MWKFAFCCAGYCQRRGGLISFFSPFARLSQLLEQNSELLLGQFRHALEESQLVVEIVIGAIEPEPSADRAV